MSEEYKWVEIRIKFTTLRTAKDQAEAFEQAGVKTKIEKDGKVFKVFKKMRA